MVSESARDGSVYDILYADTRRLSSLLSQFSDDGLLVELSRAVEDTDTVQGSVDVKVVKVGGSSAARSTTSRRIDPQWLLPLLFLDEAKELIERDIKKASIGSMVLAQGKLVVTDIRILQKLWSNPQAKKLMLEQIRSGNEEEADSGNRASRRAQAKKKENSTEAEMMFEILPLLPHSPQVNIITTDAAVWSTIDPANFVGSVEDLILKHGAKVPGSWSMVGILDARPFEDREDGDYDDFLGLEEQIYMGMSTDNLWKVATQLAQPARQALGRPFISYGVTPLIIFREIETPVKESE